MREQPAATGREPQPGVSDARRRRLGAFLDRIGQLWTVGVLVLLIAGFALANDKFISQTNWLTTSVYATGITVAAVGETFVIISGGIDLSVGALLGFSAMVGALVMKYLTARHLDASSILLAGTLAALTAGMLGGLVNGALITKLRLSPVIVTLGMLGMATGGTNLLNGGREVTEFPDRVGEIGNSVVAGWLPFPVLVTVAVCVLAGLALARTRFGRHVYAIGSNHESARRAGIPTENRIVAVYVLSGLMAAVAGILITSRFAVASPLAGGNLELDAIAAVVIGGASLFGGRGTVLGTVVGSAIISVLLTGLILAEVAPFWQTVVEGAIIIAAVYVDQLRIRFAER